MGGGRAWRFSAAVTASALLVSGSAHTQTTATSAGQPGGRVQEIDLIANVIYDSNVASSTTALAGSRRLTPGDEIFEPRLHFDLSRPVGRETFYVQGDAGYDFHARNTLLNRENIDIVPGILAQVGPCQTSLSGEYSRAQSNLAELSGSIAGLTVPFQAKNVLQVEQVGGQANCIGSTGFGPSVTASEIRTLNSSPVQRYADAQTFSGSGGLSYQRPVLGSVRLFGAFSQSNFPNRQGLIALQGAGVSTGYQTISAGVTYSRAVGSRLQGSLSVSYTKLDQQSSASGASSGGFSGITYSAALAYRVSSRLHANGTVSRATVPSIRLNSTFSIDQLYSAELGYDLSSRLTVDAGASFNHQSFNGVPYPLGVDVTDDKTYAAFGDIDLKISRRLTLGLNARRIQRTANLPGLSYPETRVGLTARATF